MSNTSCQTQSNQMPFSYAQSRYQKLKLENQPSRQIHNTTQNKRKVLFNHLLQLH